MDKVLNEQYLSMNGWMEGNGAVKTGELLGAKAILSGKLLSVKSQIRSPQLKREKAYKRRVEKYFNNVTQKTESKYVYDKIYYNNYKGHTQVSISFQYILVSTETGEILDSGIEEKVIIIRIQGIIKTYTRARGILSFKILQMIEYIQTEAR